MFSRMTTLEFYNNLMKQVSSLSRRMVIKDDVIKLLEPQIEALNNLFSKWLTCDNDKLIKFANSLLKDILKSPNNSNGKVYEALVYSWLNENFIEYEPQWSVAHEDCFKSSCKYYAADGKIVENNIVFDVKKFGLTIPILNILKDKIMSNINFLQNYYLTIGGSKSISTVDIKKLLENPDELTGRIFNSKNKICNDYIYHEFGLEFRAWNLCANRSLSSFSEFDPYQWAENNELYFMYHSSQFCNNSPYIIFCPFDKTLIPMFSNNNRTLTLAFRSLCRRIFIRLINESNQNINQFDGKAKSEISVAEASKKVSAIVFMDVSKKSKYNDSGVFAYLNPNADYKIANYQVNSLFRNAGALIDDFKFDNY